MINKPIIRPISAHIINLNTKTFNQNRNFSIIKLHDLKKTFEDYKLIAKGIDEKCEPQKIEINKRMEDVKFVAMSVKNYWKDC